MTDDVIILLLKLLLFLFFSFSSPLSHPNNMEKVRWLFQEPIVVNVLPAAMLLTVDKLLFRVHHWPSGVLLAVLHLLCNFLSLHILRLRGVFTRAVDIPFAVVMSICLPLSSATAVQTLSLKANSFGTFVLLKQLVLPCTALAELALGQRSLSMGHWIALCGIFAGVVFATAKEMNENPVGIAIGLLDTTLSVTGQMVLSHYLRAKIAAPLQLRYETYLRGGWVVIITLMFEIAMDRDSISFRRYDWCSVGSWGVLLASCVLSPVVSVSYYFVVGKYSALVYQLLQPLKLVIAMALSSVLLGDSLTQRQQVSAGITCLSLCYWALLSKEKEGKEKEKEKGT